MSKPFFSVVIPALNEEKYIGQILTDLTKQSFQDFEVIVSDANSTDKTVEKVNTYKKKYPLTIASSKKKNLSHQRNVGAQKAQGKYLFFIDADNRIPNEFLSVSKDFIDENKCDAVIPYLKPDRDNILDKFIYPLSTFLIKLFLPTPRPFSTGGNMIIRKAAFERTDGFGDKLVVGEDHDMIRQLRKIGSNIKLMQNTYVIFSMRRFDQNGLEAYWKFAYGFCYLIIFPNMKKSFYSYKMGGDNFL